MFGMFGRSSLNRNHSGGLIQVLFGRGGLTAKLRPDMPYRIETIPVQVTHVDAFL